jgi:hypothetical protein
MDLATLTVHQSGSRSTLCRVNKSNSLISLYLISKRKSLHEALMMVIKKNKDG